jgi:hypothetical protein
MAKKATEAEMQIRIKECVKLLLQGYSRPDIYEYGTEKWGIGRGPIDIAIARATERIKEANSASIQQNLAVISTNYWQLYREARASKQIGLAAQILAQIARIKGVEKHVITHVIEDQRELENASDEDLDTILVEYSKSSD